MASNEFQREVGAFLLKNFPLVYRLDDAAFNRYGRRQVSKKDFDFFGATKTGLFFVAESKRVKTPRFPFINLEEHQRNGLEKVLNYSIYSWLFINWRTNHRAGYTVWLPYKVYIDIENNLIMSGNKSIKYENIPEIWKLNRITGGWDVPITHPLYKCL